MKGYLALFETEEQAIGHCRQMNRGRTSQDPDCLAVVDGPGGEFDPEWSPGAATGIEANFAVVDLESARELLDDGIGPPIPYLIVTD